MWKNFNSWFDGGGGLKLSIWLAIAISVGSFLFFFSHDQWNLAYYDALSHLNSGRKVFDNLTPGFTQLGGLWLPLTHILLIPFIWNDAMWQFGLAGYLVSGLSFIFSVALIHKVINLIVQNQKAAFLGVLVYMTNINIVYIQTMGMMESLFNLTIIGSIYYLVKWTKSGSISDLILGGLFVAACTITRYEGYAVLLMAVFLVVIISLWKNRGTSKKTIVEGNFILFTTVAGVGVVLWTIYLFAIFGDPLHWLHPYDNSAEVSVQGLEKTEFDVVPAKLNIPIPTVQDENGVFYPEYYHDAIKSLSYLFSATAGSVGMPVLCTALIGLLYLLGNIRHTARISAWGVLIAIGISVSLFFFLFFSMYFGKISVWGPSFFSGNIFDRSSNFFEEAGIRYTLALLPFVAIAIGIISSGAWYRKIVLVFLIIFQVSAVFFGPLFLTFNLSLKWRSIYGHEIMSSNWFNDAYSGGLVLISSLTHEAEMFHNGIRYENYIHEGTGEYWRASLESPKKYANWIIMNSQVTNSTSGVWGTDILTKRATLVPTFLDGFDLVYEDKSTKIYKNKTAPDVDLLKILGR